MLSIDKAEVVLERMEMVNVTVPVPEPVKTKAQLKAESTAAKVASSYYPSIAPVLNTFASIVFR